VPIPLVLAGLLELRLRSRLRAHDSLLIVLVNLRTLRCVHCPFRHSRSSQLRRAPVPTGFRRPVPPRFTETVEEYRRWLVTELERFEQPVDLVGHDWGGAHVMNVAMTRPELVCSWVCDVIGLFDQDYQWHDLGRVWATPGVGEDAIAAMIDPSVTERAAALVKKGMHEDVTLRVAEGQNAAMGECILRLYRDAAQPAMARLGRNLERAAARPGLSIMATEDHLAGTDEQRRRASARAGAGAEIAELDGLAHWWLTQDPQRGAATINRFLAGVGQE
jgi:pimeloyl-ACP methyl ester carboxylesterase